jgi:hypothetical protein
MTTGFETFRSYRDTDYDQVAELWTLINRELAPADMRHLFEHHNFETGRIDTSGFRKVFFGDANFGSGLSASTLPSIRDRLERDVDRAIAEHATDLTDGPGCRRYPDRAVDKPASSNAAGSESGMATGWKACFYTPTANVG